MRAKPPIFWSPLEDLHVSIMRMSDKLGHGAIHAETLLEADKI